MLPLVVTGVVSLVTAIGTLSQLFKDVKKDIDPVIGAIKNAGTNDLITLTKVCRMEPLVLVDDRLRLEPSMPDVLQVITSLIAGYYIQTFAVLGKIDGIDVIGTLDKLNPARTGIGLNSLEENQRTQSHRVGNGNGIGFYSIGLEAMDDDAKADDQVEKDGTVSYKTDKNTVSEITQITNLAVGKMIKVTMSANGKSVEIPITIRVKPITTDQDTIVATLALGSNKNTTKQRWMRFRAGELSFSNMLFGDDVIAQHKSVLIKDKSGFYAEVVRRAQGNAKKGILSGNLSLATDSNVIIITAETALKTSRELGGSLDDFAIREQVFKTIHCNILIIIDQNRGMITFHYRGERIGNKMSLQDIKMANKGTGPDIMSIFSAFQENRIPAL